MIAKKYQERAGTIEPPATIHKTEKIVISIYKIFTITAITLKLIIETGITSFLIRIEATPLATLSSTLKTLDE
jgi:hypothetical protein